MVEKKISDLIKKVGKHNFLFVTKNKVVVFASNNNKKEAIMKTEKKIKSKLSSLKNKNIVYIKLNKVPDKDIKENEKSKLKFVGGVVKATVNIMLINDDGKIVVDNQTMSSRVFFTEKYLSKKGEIPRKDLKKIAYYAMTGKLKTSLMAINTMEEINKQEINKQEEKKPKKKPKKKPEKKEKKKERKKPERIKTDLDKNSFYAQFPVRQLDDILKNFTNHTRLYLMNKGHKVKLLEEANIDKSKLPEPETKRKRQYGIVSGKVKPYNEKEQEIFFNANYDELHPLLAKPLDKIKQKEQFERNIKIVLKPHQKKFISSFITSFFKGCLLFHSVGSGKTLTAVSFSHYYLSLFPKKNVLLLAPPSLLFNFVDGMKEFGLDIRDNRYKFETYIKFTKNPSKYINSDTLIIIDEVHNFRTYIQFDTVEINGKVKEVPKKGKVAYDIIKQCQKANKILAMTGTAFVNNLYDIENIMAMINQRDPLSKEAFFEITDDKDLSFDYFKYRLSYFNVFNTEAEKFFPEKRQIYQPIKLKPNFREYYKMIANGDNIFNDDGSYIKLEEHKRPERDEFSDIAFKVLQTINKETGQKELAEGNELTSFLNAPRQYSNLVEGAKIKFIIEKLNENPDYKSIVYSNFITSSINILRKKLTENNIKFTQITGSETALTRNNNKIKFNDLKSDIQVLIISKAGTEGVSTRNVRQIFLMESLWNEASSEQAIARAVRFKSHIDLPKNQRFVNIYRLQIVLNNDDKEFLKNINNNEYINLLKQKNTNQKKIEQIISNIFKVSIDTPKPSKLNKKAYSKYLDRLKEKQEEIEIIKSKLKEFIKSRKGKDKIKVVIEFFRSEAPKIDFLKNNKSIKQLQKLDKENDILKRDLITNDDTQSSDIRLTQISLNKQSEIDIFINELENNIPNIEKYKDVFQNQIIDAIDKEKNVEKLLKKQRQILDKIGNKTFETSEKIIEKYNESMKKIANSSQLTEQLNQFFTNKQIIKKLIKKSEKIKKIDFIRIFDPTAGSGNIALQIIKFKSKQKLDKGYSLDLCEFDMVNRRLLEDLVKKDPMQINLKETRNFFKLPQGIKYDLIMMNPPDKEIIKGKTIRDWKFIKHAYDNFLKDNGELLTIVSSNRKKSANSFYDKVNAQVLEKNIKLESGLSVDIIKIIKSI